MANNYEEIVRQWYNRLRPEFLRRLTARYSSLTLYDAENLYQDAFIAVQKNIMEGRVRENTSWSSYIMTIGMNLANHEIRKKGITDSLDEETEEDKVPRKVPDILKVLPTNEYDSLYDDPEAKVLLGEELSHTPEPCNSIILLYYYEDLSMKEIAERVGLKNAITAKSKKSQCMTDLMHRVERTFKNAGFDVKLKKRNRNGRN